MKDEQLGFETALTKLVSGSPNMLWEHMKLIVSSIRAMRTAMTDLSLWLFSPNWDLQLLVKLQSLFYLIPPNAPKHMFLCKISVLLKPIFFIKSNW